MYSLCKQYTLNNNIVPCSWFVHHEELIISNVVMVLIVDGHSEIHSRQSLLIDLYNAFDERESSHKSNFLLFECS